MNEKLGYRQEAYLRDELFIDGKFEDLILYGALEGDVR
jgi:RimJ/RimL family protein N-acetyltransferase